MNKVQLMLETLFLIFLIICQAQIAMRCDRSHIQDCIQSSTLSTVMSPSHICSYTCSSSQSHLKFFWIEAQKLSSHWFTSSSQLKCNIFTILFFSLPKKEITFKSSLTLGQPIYLLVFHFTQLTSVRLTTRCQYLNITLSQWFPNCGAQRPSRWYVNRPTTFCFSSQKYTHSYVCYLSASVN